MPYYPLTPTIEPEPYYCPNCKAWYLRVDTVVACAVFHGPGSCCHFSEVRVEDPDGEE